MGITTGRTACQLPAGSGLVLEETSMCYWALCCWTQLEASFRQDERMFGGRLDLPSFFDVYAGRAAGTYVEVH